MTDARLAALLLAVLAPAAAAEPPRLAKIDAAAVPADVKPGATTLDGAYTFTDKNGTNYLLFSNQRTCDTGLLVVDHYAVAAGAKTARLVRRVKELVESCSRGMTLDVHAGATGVTDLDGDGYAELTFAYQVGCRSDVSPDDYKLLLLENADKYILRGQTRVSTGDPDQPTVGGDFKPDPAKGKWPAAFYKRATDLWKQTVSDSMNDHD